MRAKVDLPEPDSPTMPNERPRRMEKLTPASAGRALFREKGPTPGKRIGFDEVRDLEQRRLAHRASPTSLAR